MQRYIHNITYLNGKVFELWPFLQKLSDPR